MRRSILAVPLLLALAAAPAFAGGASDFVGSTEFSVLAGSLSLDKAFVPSEEKPALSRYIPEIDLQGGFLWGVRLGHRFTRHFETEMTLGYASGEVQAADTLGALQKFTGLTTVVYNLEALVYLPAAEKFEPYAAVGFGGTSYRPSSVAHLDRTAALTGNAGGGVRYYLNDKFAVRGDARVYLLSFDRDTFFRLYPNFAPQTSARTLTHVELSLGLTLRFFDTDLF